MTKISALGADPTPTTDDYTITVDSTSGATKKVQWANLANLFQSIVMPYVYPVGAIYIETTGTDPNTTFGFGTWVQYAKGRALVGVDDAGTFAGEGTEVGAETVTLTTAEMPSHNHTGTTSTGGSHTHAINRDVAYTDGSTRRTDASGALQAYGFGDHSLMNSAGSHNHTITTNSTGGGGAHANIQPSVTVYVWKRTA